jgi:CheY-like chemotaxis protein
MNPTPEVNHNVVSERLRFVDILVKAGRIGDAINEVDAVKQIDPANPYAQAYGERLRTIRRPLDTQAVSTPATIVEHTSSKGIVPVSPGIAQQHAVGESEDCATGQFEDFLRSAERQQPKVLDSFAGMRISPDLRSKGRASIVLVDDDELLLMALVELLEDNKYTTKSFTKSEDALEYIKGHRPDLVLCDVNLQTSSFGGFSLFEKMAKLGHLHNVPFIFMSGLIDVGIIRAGKELGADDYLTKPIEPDMLLSVVKGKLRKYMMIEKVF